MPSIRRVKPFEVPGKPWGTELVFTEPDAPYLGKVLSMRAGTGGALQYHMQKEETFYLLAGEARVTWSDHDGHLFFDDMLPGQAYHVPPGAIHQVEAKTDCVLIEASTPVFGDRVKIPTIGAHV
jgi:mannose-6-phosphate isomerase